MIKGVNRKIIEINNTDSIYFEKAVLYIRPQMSDVPNSCLSHEAALYLAEKAGTVSRQKRKKKIITAVSVIAAAAAAVLILILK